VPLFVLDAGQIVAAVGAGSAGVASSDASIAERVAARNQQVVESAQVHLAPIGLTARCALRRRDVLVARALPELVVAADRAVGGAAGLAAATDAVLLQKLAARVPGIVSVHAELGWRFDDDERARRELERLQLTSSK
jgi:hypothetical protein